MKPAFFIGDIHSQFAALERAVEFCVRRDFRPILLGDVFDSRCEISDSVGVFRLVRQIQLELDAVVLNSNHQDKLIRFLKGGDPYLRVMPELARTVGEFEQSDVDRDELLSWLESLPDGFVFRENGREFRCAHAFFPSWLEVPEFDKEFFVKDLPRKTRQLLLYGPNDRETRKRVEWWRKESDREWVRVAGHYHHIHHSETSLVLDGGCGGTSRSWFCRNPAVLVGWAPSEGVLTEFPVGPDPH